jgi:hypothetical protein
MLNNGQSKKWNYWFTPLNVVYGNNHFEHANYYYNDLNVLNNYNDELIPLKNGFKKINGKINETKCWN